MNRAATPNQRDLTANVVRALTLYSFAEFQLGHAASIQIRAEGNLFSIADDIRSWLALRGLQQSMSGTGNCYEREAGPRTTTRRWKVSGIR